jgi:peptidoglycan/LPS O-acetylase OafA/YrhL
MGLRNYALDGLRGLAALAVALSHCNLAVSGPAVWALTLSQLPGQPFGDVVGRLAYVLFPGDAAVTLFFVLSGHVLWESFFKNYGRSIGAFPEYLLTRLYRLLPVAIASAIPLGLLAGIVLPPLDASELAKTMLMLSVNTNGVLWSLQVEVVCSLLLFFVWMLVRGSTPALIAALVVSFILYRATKIPYLLFFPSFLAGALISRAPERFSRHVWISVLGVILLIGTSLLIGHGWRSRYGETLGAYLLIAYVRNMQPALLVSRPVHFLGMISYPFYLLHVVGLRLAAHFLADHSAAWPAGRFIAFAAISVLVTVPLAWFVHISVELPAIRGRPRFSEGRRQTSPTVTLVPPVLCEHGAARMEGVQA